MKRNPSLPKTPQIWIDGYRYPFRPECANCGLISDVPSPKYWDYVELSPFNDWGYLCPHCQREAS